jgi:hypothetical protein
MLPGTCLQEIYLVLQAIYEALSDVKRQYVPICPGPLYKEVSTAGLLFAESLKLFYEILSTSESDDNHQSLLFHL